MSTELEKAYKWLDSNYPKFNLNPSMVVLLRDMARRLTEIEQHQADLKKHVRDGEAFDEINRRLDQMPGSHSPEWHTGSGIDDMDKEGS